jgi:hypothetical protein
MTAILQKLDAAMTTLAEAFFADYAEVASREYNYTQYSYTRYFYGFSQ